MTLLVPTRRAGPVALVVLCIGLASSVAAAGSTGLDPSKALTQYNLDIWTAASGLPQSTLTAVAQTRDGYLWIGTWSGLARFDGVRFSVFDKSNAPGLRNSGVQTLLADPDGGLWVGTNGGGLSLYRDGAFTTYTQEDGLAGDIVRALHKDARGRLWIGTNGGLSVLESGRLKSWTQRDGLPNEIIRAIVTDRQGVLWVGTNGGGLARFDA